MQFKTVSKLKTDVARILTGIDLDDTPDIYGAFEQAVSTLIQKADVPEASGNEPIMLYDGVTDYIPSPDVFNASLIDIRQQGIERQPWDETTKETITRWDQEKGWTPSGYNVTFEYYNGQQIIRISQNKTMPRVVLDPMSDTSGWVASGDASNLAKDTTVYWHQPAALRFNLAQGGSLGILTKTLDNPINLNDYLGIGVNFLATMFPDGSGITSVTLRLGSSAANYYEMAVTEAFLGAWVDNQFMLTALDLADATTTGTPDISAIEYVQIRIAYDGAVQANVRFGDLWIALPCANEILYYSAAVFLADGVVTPSTDINDDDDTIILRNGTYNIYVQEAARQVAQDQGGGIASGLIAGIDLVLEGNGERKLGLYQAYRGDNPSEELRQIGSYYDSGYGGNYGRGNRG